jgi:hypothetical protein
MIAAMPGAWYDLAGRVKAVQAVASCALEAVPGGLQGDKYVQSCHAASLIAAMQDILKLMEGDVDLIEAQLKL